MNAKNKILWSFLSVFLAVLTIHVIFKQSKELSPAAVLSMLGQASPAWLILAGICVLLYIYLEGKAILLLLDSAGYHRRDRDGLVYSAADIYFSAITPSASGGQPASMFFMIRDGIPGSVVTVTLLVNLILYTLSILLIGLLCMIIRPSVFMHFQIFSRGLIIFGYVALSLLALIFAMMLFHQKMLQRLGHGLIKLGRKIGIIHHPLRIQKRLARAMSSFADCREQMTGHTNTLLKAFLCNFLQRMTQIIITVIMFMATGGTLERALDVWAVQSYVVIGSNCIPIPGAMGISDYLLIDGFHNMLGRSAAFQLEMLSRSVSFYICVVFCLLITGAGYFIGQRKGNK